MGGGFSGLVLAVGLQKYPRIKVQVYEAARAFSEIGFDISIGPNAQRATEITELQQVCWGHPLLRKADPAHRPGRKRLTGRKEKSFLPAA